MYARRRGPYRANAPARVRERPSQTSPRFGMDKRAATGQDRYGLARAHAE